MPTGYTAAVQDGTITELEPFIMDCARGMGALVMMRDEPHGAPIPERFEPSDYHARKLAEAYSERGRLYAMTEQMAQEAADAEHAEWVRDRANREQEHAEHRARYEAMIAKVEAWTGAPEGIKEFALSQLRESLDFDCRLPFKYWSEEPSQDGAAWKAAKLQKAADDIAYHARGKAEEEARTEGRNAWLSQLRLSLKHPEDRRMEIERSREDEDDE